MIELDPTKILKVTETAKLRYCSGFHTNAVGYQKRT